MKVLTLTQPWATLVAIGAKTIETRSWRNRYRGPLLIHAAKGMPRLALETCFEHPFAEALKAAGIETPADLPRGAIVAHARLIHIAPTTEVEPALLAAGRHDELAFGDYSPGRWAWRLAGVTPMPIPVPAKGSLGLWEIDMQAVEDVSVWQQLMSDARST